MAPLAGDVSWQPVPIHGVRWRLLKPTERRSEPHAVSIDTKRDPSERDPDNNPVHKNVCSGDEGQQKSQSTSNNTYNKWSPENPELLKDDSHLISLDELPWGEL